MAAEIASLIAALGGAVVRAQIDKAIREKLLAPATPPVAGGQGGQGQDLAVQCAGFKLGECGCSRPCSVRLNVDVDGLNAEHVEAIGEELLDLLESMGWEGELDRLV